jgi:Dolichyl-phosphate-mannose-protein mannosyltransferase
MTTAGVCRLGLRIVLGLLVLVTAYGFYEGKLFHQTVWLPAGLHRFLLFAAVYVTTFTVFSLWKPSLFSPAISVFVFVYSLIAVSPLALLSVVLFVLSSAVLGQSILAPRGAPPRNSVPDGVLAMLLGMCIHMFAASLAVHLPINYPVVYLLALIAPLAWNLRSTVAWLSRIRLLFTPMRLERWTVQAAFGALVFVLLSHWLLTLEPEIAPDALAMHLGIPESVAMFHKWAFDFKQVVWAVMPMGADWCFTIVNLLGGEAAARLLNFSLLLAIVALLFSAARKWLPSGPALLIVAMFAATPVVQLVTCSLFSENLWVALALGAVWALAQYREQRSERLFYAAFILLGGAAATKYAALAFLAPAAAIALVVRWRRPGMLRAVCGAVLVFLVFAAPPYLTAYLKTGNPVYPFLNSVFRSPYFDSAVSFTGAAANFPITPRTPYDLTFHTSRLPEVQDGATGFQYFLFLPLALLLLVPGFRKCRVPLPDGRGSETLSSFSFIAFVLFAILTMRIQPHLRYLYAAFPFATVVIAWAFAALRTLDRALYRVATALSIVLFFLNLYFLPTADWFHKDSYVNALSSRARTQYLAEHAPVRNLIDYLNRMHPGAAVAFFETTSTAGLHGVAYTDSWHSPEFHARIVQALSADDCRRLMLEHGVKYFVAPSPDSAISFSEVQLQRFLARCTEPESRSGNFYVAKLRPDGACRPNVGPPEHEYDPSDEHIEYEGPWGRGPFPQTSRGMITASNTAGASFHFSFNGTEVTYVYTKAFNRGIAEISIDGISQGDLDLYSASTQWQSRSRFVCGQRGPHTLVVRVTGHKNPNSMDTFVDVDEIVVP